MPGGMPYQLEKGPYFAVAETMLDFGGSAEARFGLLALMRAGTDADELPTLDSTNLNAGPLPTADARRDHMDEHWFGKTRANPSAPWQPQAPLDPTNPKRTGFWNNWYGDADGIVAKAFIRAVEVSLGIEHESMDAPSRFWPIEIFWRCPAPWLEAWVTWREAADGAGHVTVHLHTPSHDASALLLGPKRGAPDNARHDYLDEPVACDMEKGMWVIAHEQQEQLPYYAPTNPTPPTPPGQPAQHWQLPTFGPFYYSHGPIVAVQPNEPDGGVRHSGRPYVPPT
jgi:hypothetical protein